MKFIVRLIAIFALLAFSGWVGTLADLERDRLTRSGSQKPTQTDLATDFSQDNPAAVIHALAIPKPPGATARKTNTPKDGTTGLPRVRANTIQRSESGRVLSRRFFRRMWAQPLDSLKPQLNGRMRKPRPPLAANPDRDLVLKGALRLHPFDLTPKT